MTGPAHQTEGPQEAHRRGFLRRAAKVAAVLLGVVVVLAVVALLAARLYLTEDRVRRIAVEQLDEALLGHFAVGDLEWIDFPTEVALKDVRVETPDGEPVLVAERLAASVELLPLLDKQVRLDDVRVSGLVVRLVPPADPEADVTYTLIEAFRPVEPAEEPDREVPGWSVRVRDVQAEDLRFELRTRGGTEVRAWGVSVSDGALTMEGAVLEVTGAAGAEHVEVTTDGRTVALGPLVAEGLRYHADDEGPTARFDLDAARFQGDGFEGHVAGRLTDLTGDSPIGFSAQGEVTLDLQAQLVRDLVPAETWARLEPAGTVKVDFTGEGTLEAPEVRVGITGAGLQTAFTVVERLALDAAWSAAGLTVDRLELAVPDASLTASGRLGLTGADLGYALKARLERVPVRALGSPWVDARYLPAQLSGTFEAKGSALRGPEGTARLDLQVAGLPSVAPAGLPDPVRVAGTVVLAGERARLSPLRLSGAGASLRLEGSVPLDASGRLDLQVGADLTRPDPILRGLDLPLRAAEAHLTAKVSGTVRAPAAEGTLTADEVRIQDLPVADLDVPFRFADGTLHLDRARVQAAGGSARATGRLELMRDGEPLDSPRADLVVRVEDVRLGPFTDGAVAGRAFFEGRVTGPLDAPVGRGRARVEELAVQGVRFSEARALVVAEGDRIQVRELMLAPQAGGTLQGTATVHLDPQRIEAELRGEAVPLSVVDEAVVADIPVRGRADLTLSLAGPLRSPGIEARLDLSEVIARDTPVGDVTARVSGTPGELEIDVQAASPAGGLGLTGRVDAEGRTVDLILKSERIDLSELPYVADTDFDGVIDVDLTVKGTLPAVRADGVVRILELTYEGGRIGTGEGLVRIEHVQDGLHRVEAAVAGAADLDARIDTGPPLDLELTGKLSGLSLSWFAAALQEAEVDAVVDGDLGVRYRGDPAALSAEVTLSRLDVQLAEETLRNQGPVRIVYADDVVSLRGMDLAGPRGTFQASGTVGEALDLTAKGTLEMEIIAPLVSAIARSSGTVEVDLHVTGAPAEPRLDGDARIVRAVRIRPRRMIREVEITSGHVVFSPGLVRLRSLNGEMQGGVFRANGELAIEGFEPRRYDLTFSGQNLPLRTEELVLEANADLKVTGEAAQALISGRVDVVRGRYLRKFELDQFVFRAADRDIDEPLARRFPWLANLLLDVRATSTGGMEVDVNAGAFALQMGLDADLRVTGTAADPVIDGRVAASRGEIQFPRAELEVVRAIIEFTPALGEGLAPDIDLRAEGEVTPPYTGDGVQVAYFVTLTLDGSIDEMELDLFSDPPLDKLEVLSLLVTGQVNPLTGGPGQGGAAGAAMVFAGSQLAEPLTRFVTKGLEDLINLELQLGAQVSAQGLTVTAGKEVTRRLRLEGVFQRAFGEDVAIATARARYLISDRLFLEGVAESVTGQSQAAIMPREGNRSRLELKYRIFGD